MLAFLLACAADAGPETRHGRAGAGHDDTGTPRGDPADSGDSGGADEAPAGPCPAGMALVGEALCVDQWEATIEGHSPYEVPEEGAGRPSVSAEGVVPQAYISGEVAAEACAAAGKRLCSVDEWMLACAGKQDRTYPYGNTYDLYACNDTYAGSHPVVDYFGTSDGIWDTEHMNDPGINQQEGTVSETGAFEDCVTPESVYDLHGNLHEWVSDSAGTFKGGFYADAVINGEGCAYTTTAHDRSYHDYSTGFRCCQSAE